MIRLAKGIQLSNADIQTISTGKNGPNEYTGSMSNKETIKPFTTPENII